jgi:post-segregation antitoxin (ccd killing protein)
MPRMQVYLPDDLYAEVKAQELPASELLQQAVRAELRRRALLRETDRYLEELAAEVGAPSPRDLEAAEEIAARLRARLRPGG